MQGRRPDSVTAIAQHIKPDVYPRVDDEATIILTYPKAQAIIQASWNWPFDRKDMEVYGQTGYAITVRRDDIRVRRKGAEEEQLSAKAISAPNDNSLAYFKAVVNGEIPPEGLSSLETNITVTEIHTITGGTGRFAGAQGNFVLVRTHLVALSADGTHVTFGSFHGTITYPGGVR